MKKFLLACCALGFLVCSTAGIAAEAKKVRIALLIYGMKAEFSQLMQHYAMLHPAVTKGLAEVTLYDGRYDAAVQNDQARMAAISKFDAVLVVPFDFEANVDVVKISKDAKIPVVVFNAMLDTKDMDANVQSNDVVGGYLEGKAVLAKMGCKGNVVIIEGPKGGSGEIQRGKGNEQAIAECPKGAVTVLERKTANWSRAEALDLMQNWLSKDKGKIQGIIGQNDEMALGAIEAVKAAGLNVKDFSIAGIDGVSDALNSVKAGEMTSILQDAKALTQASIDIAMRRVKGPDYKPMSPVWEQYANTMKWDDGMAAFYDVPWTVVTPENADALLKDRQ
jgi:putative xylitol transport system substrate-binding protein